jgi:hypothetical protein
MARGGFAGGLARFGRAITRTIENIFAPSPPPRPPAPAPEPPAPKPNEYRNVWRHERGKGSYRKNRSVFDRMMDDVDTPQDERIELWESYVHNIVNDKGRYRRNSTSNMFWRDSGIDPADFNWAAWRQAMGYTGKRRSRTP